MTTPAAIDFFFDFASPYGYLMSETIDVMAKRHGCTVTWRPMLLFAVLRALGLPAPLEHPVKRDYMLADFERSASFLGIDYRMPPKFPVITPYAARAFYLLADQAPDSAVPFAHAVMRSYWRDGQDITDIGLISDLVYTIGWNVGSVVQIGEHLRGDAAKARLQDAVSAAVARRVFGSPFVIVDGEPFFGMDRLPQIEARLSRVVGAG